MSRPHGELLDMKRLRAILAEELSPRRVYGRGRGNSPHRNLAADHCTGRHAARLLYSIGGIVIWMLL